jgi:hypothetical protein
MGHSRSTYYDRSERAGDDKAMFAICDAFEAYGYRAWARRCVSRVLSSITRRSDG